MAHDRIRERMRKNAEKRIAKERLLRDARERKKKKQKEKDKYGHDKGWTPKR